MAKTYSIQEVQQKLAKHIEGMIERVADDIQDLAKREQIKKSLWATAHEEPGQHEAQEPGVAPHMEPGGHEHFEMNPTAGPDAATAEPIQGGNGVPPGQLADPNHQMISMVMGDGPCPLCQQPEQSCHCLDSAVLGKALEKGDSDEHYNHYLVHSGTGKVHGGYEYKQDAHDAAKDHEHAGSLKVTHRSRVPHAAKEAFHRENDAMDKLHKDDMGMGGPGSLEMSEIEKSKISGGQSTGGASTGMGGGPGGALSMSEEDGRNKDPSKKQPSKPVDGAKMPPEAPKQIKSVDGKKPQPNPLNKVGVPEAKPPSGKVPGGSSAPPMASTTSKPGMTKEEPIAKAVMQAAPPAGGAPKPGGQSMASQMKGGGATALTHPSDTSRAAGHAAAMGGAFTPKGPISSGLELAPKAGAPGAAGAKPPAPGGMPKPGGMAPAGLKPPAPAARGVAPGGMPSMPKPGVAGMAAPKPMGAPVAAPGAAPAAKPGIFGKLFGKSEKCALCGKEEHLGQCK